MRLLFWLCLHQARKTNGDALTRLPVNVRLHGEVCATRDDAMKFPLRHLLVYVGLAGAWMGIVCAVHSLMGEPLKSRGLGGELLAWFLSALIPLVMLVLILGVSAVLGWSFFAITRLIRGIRLRQNSK